MKIIGWIIRFYFICNISIFLFSWTLEGFAIDASLGYGMALCSVLWSPLYTIYITLIHILRINTKIKGNLVHEIVVSLVPIWLLELYDIITYRMMDENFIMLHNNKVFSQKWFMDATTSYIIIFLILTILLYFHGHGQLKDRSGHWRD